MLKNIKCKYILKAIFEYIRNKINLKIIKYNRKIKKALSIIIDDYKIYKFAKNLI